MEYGSSPPPRVVPATSSPWEVTGGDSSTDSVQLQPTPNQDSLARESMPMEWTNEKHSLYLKSMETSFVNEMYNSVDMLCWRSQKEHSPVPKFSKQKHATTRPSSGQFKVLRDGCWGKINFKKHESQLDKEDNPGVLLANPWIQHFRSSCTHQNVACSALQEKAAFGSPAVRVSGKTVLSSAALDVNLEHLPAFCSHLCRCDSNESNTEVTDQNFVDEDIEVEQASPGRTAKRMKSSAPTKSTDQIVPLTKFSATAHGTMSFSHRK